MELELAQKILKRFEIDDAVMSINQNKTGLINQTFELSTQKNKYILQELNTKVFPNYQLGLQNIILIKEWLKKTNYSYEFPSPILNQYKGFDHKMWRLLPFVNNSRSINKISNINEVKESVKCIAEFYNNLKEFPVEKLNVTIPNFHFGEHKILAFNEALKNSNRLRKKNAEPLILEIKKKLKILNKWDEICMTLPKRVVHYDTKINNFLFEKTTNKVIALIDLDTLMPGCVLSDVGDMIRTYSNTVGEEFEDISKVICNKTIVYGILDRFEKLCKLEGLEKQNMFFGGLAITLMQSIRFLTDFLNNDIYYSTNYENHNLIRANNQYQLFVSLKKLNP
ncbi:MAG: phosphotransferase [Flavobacteriales bacterium]|nr:phosphotransferase [Flavobacteriales bacterium]